MSLRWTDWPAALLERLRAGCVIPAHPLALTAERRLDPRRQRALSRYYLDAGAGGLAVGVHTTQFAIREVGLYEPVLRIAAEAAAGREALLVAGAIGRTEQAVREARIARDLGYHAVLLSLAAWKGAAEEDLERMIAEAATFVFHAARRGFDVTLSLPRVTVRAREGESATPIFRALALLEGTHEPVHQILDRDSVYFGMGAPASGVRSGGAA